MKRFLCVAAMAMLPASVFGGDLENRTEVTGFGGVNWLSSNLGTHANFGGSVGYGFDSRTLLFAELGHTPIASGPGGSASLLDLRAGVKYSLRESERVEPYAFVATGLGRFREPGAGISTFGIHGGVGARLYVSPRWGFVPEASFGRYFRSVEGVTSVRFTGGIFFQFGQ